jgi:hypothetical protein
MIHCSGIFDPGAADPVGIASLGKEPIARLGIWAASPGAALLATVKPDGAKIPISRMVSFFAAGEESHP